MLNIKRQTGFTLVEIAIVLVIIGLLLGGILKGQELINSARVRNLADQNSGIQAAYYGFIDRYRQVPGDYQGGSATAPASVAIGQTINLPATSSTTAGNGRIDHTLEEAAAVWEQLSKSNFIGGGFTPASAVPTISTYPTNAPRNAFNGALVLTRNDGYSGTAAERLTLHLGPNVPVSIARELDVKVDDGDPNTGILRLSAAVTTSATTFDTLFATSTTPSCVDATPDYDITNDAQDCGQVFLY